MQELFHFNVILIPSRILSNCCFFDVFKKMRCFNSSHQDITNHQCSQSLLPTFLFDGESPAMKTSQQAVGENTTNLIGGFGCKKDMSDIHKATLR